MRNEELRKIRGINVMDYLNEHEPGTMIEDGANEWQHRYHSSLKFSAGMFHWFSRGIGGRSALDYLMKVEDMDFRDAVNHLCACYPQLGIAPIEKVPEKPVMKLPKANEDNDTAVTYLEGRGISRSVIDTCIEKKMLYENVRFHSVIFVGFDEKGRAAYGMYRSTDDSNRRLGELMGSNKKYSFRLTHSPMREIHLFESAIDLLSYATLLEIDGEDWTEYDLISTGGIPALRSEVPDPENLKEDALPPVLRHIIETEPELKVIHCHFDNYPAGRGCTKAIFSLLSDRFIVYDDPSPAGKDWNDYLMICKEAA